MFVVISAYVIMFLAFGVGAMIAIQAQLEHESTEPELGEVPESIAIKSHRAYGRRQW